MNLDVFNFNNGLSLYLFTLKILHGLVSAGIVKSFKGAAGGYALAKEPQDITLLEVVEQVYGTLKVSRCDGEGCTHPDGICSFRGVFNDVSDLVHLNHKG